MQQTINGFSAYVIAAEDNSSIATFIPERGGAMCSLIMLGQSGWPKELLYLHDYFWDKNIADLPGGWPFCFPVCARLERQGKPGCYLYDGKIYELPIHGFSWKKPWKIENIKDDSLTLFLENDTETFRHYPFHFRISLHYTISRNLLVCEQTYENTGDRPMPYNAGFHPYFLTPSLSQGKAEVMLQYQPTRRFQYNEKWTDLVGEQVLFDMPVSITNSEINEQLTQVAENKQIDLIYPDGDILHMTADGVEDPNLFPSVQLYTMPEKPFFCPEPWMGFPNAMNSVHGMRWLQPGQTEHGILKLWLASKNHNHGQ